MAEESDDRVVPDPEAVRADAENAADSGRAAEKLAAEIAETAEIAELGRLLDAVADAEQAWRDVRRDLEERLGAIVAETDERETLTDGVFIAAEWVPGSKKWDREAITAAVRTAALARRELHVESGEVQSEAEALEAAYRKCFRFEPRSQAVERYGIDPDQFVEKSSPGHWKAKVRVERDER